MSLGIGLSMTARRGIASVFIPEGGKWVSQTGSNLAAGTFDAPYATLQYGWAQLANGETLWVKDDLTPTVFSSTSTGTILSQAGTEGNPKTLRGWPIGTRRQIDYSSFGLDSWGGTGMRITGAWAVMRDIHITNVVAASISAPYVDALNWRAADGQMINCEISDAQGRGLTIGENGLATNLLVQNCDIHDVYDPLSTTPYGNADPIQMFGAQTGVIIEGCRLWRGSDDGIDLFFQTAPVTIRDNWIWEIGYREDGTTTGGDGTGLKLGRGAAAGAPQLLERNLMYNCRLYGISNNEATYTGTSQWDRNTAIDCGAGYELYSNGAAANLTGNAKLNGAAPILTGSGVTRDRNSFDTPPGITLTSADFLSLDASQLLLPRKADGSLPDITFAHPSVGSQLLGNGPGGTTIGAFT